MFQKLRLGGNLKFRQCGPAVQQGWDKDIQVGGRGPREMVGGSQSWEEALSTGTVQVHLWKMRGVEGTVSATHLFVSTVDIVRILLVIQGMF